MISGDLWAGAEVQMYTVMMALRECPEFELSAIVLNEGTLAEKLRLAGINVAVSDEKRLRFSQIRSEVRVFLGRTRPLILHSHRYKENILAGMAKKKGDVKRLVQTVHGIGEPFKGIRQLKSQAYSMANIYFTIKYFDRVIAVSDDIHRKLVRYLAPDKVVTIHNAIDPNGSIPGRDSELVRSEFGIGNDIPVIGSVGRMVPVKGFELFLAMAKAILTVRPEVKFMLVGDGPQRAELERKARELGITESVIFTGFRNDVTDLINCLDIFAMTSYHEGIPMALLEAMAMKKAVVSTAVGGIPEIIQDGVSGILVDSNDAGQLSAASLRLLANSDARLNLAEAARSRIEEEFSIISLRERVCRLYLGLLAKR